MSEAHAHTQQQSGLDTAVPDSDEERIHELIAQDTIITARIKAMKKLQEEKRAQLLLLMKRKGYTRRKTPEGTASSTPSSKFSVHDTDKLKELFPVDILLEHVVVNKDFYEAAKKAHIDIDSAVTRIVDTRFKVEAHRGKAAKERQAQIIEETKDELAERVERLARRMMREKRTRSE